MKQLVEFDLDDGASVLVEVDDEDSSLDYVRAASPGELAGKASQTLESALSVIRDSAKALMDKVGELTRPPNEIEIEFGVKLGGRVGAIIASTQAEGHFKVKLRWKSD